MSCECGNIAIGLTVTETRNWHPECPEHGIESEWWNSEAQFQERMVRRSELIKLQARAREARRKAREGQA